MKDYKLTWREWLEIVPGSLYGAYVLPVVCFFLDHKRKYYGDNIYEPYEEWCDRCSRNLLIPHKLTLSDRLPPEVSELLWKPRFPHHGKPTIADALSAVLRMIFGTTTTRQ